MKNFKTILTLTIIVLCSFGAYANPLVNFISLHANTLDLIYVFLGLTALWILIFYPSKIEKAKEPFKSNVNKSLILEGRKIIRKTQ
ncbi:MAG: hypothetical protein IPM51_06295 [Sphingobacteriaceae bacterium]|nr:hypothetical protein [Sphingobacteriaceae bacterium]